MTIKKYLITRSRHSFTVTPTDETYGVVKARSAKNNTIEFFAKVSLDPTPADFISLTIDLNDFNSSLSTPAVFVLRYDIPQGTNPVQIKRESEIRNHLMHTPQEIVECLKRIEEVYFLNDSERSLIFKISSVYTGIAYVLKYFGVKAL